MATRTLVIGLTTTPGGPAAPGIEVAQPSYARQTLLFELASDVPLLANLDTVEWPRATTRWGDIGWLAGWDTDGAYAGSGYVVSAADEVTAAIVRVDAGDVARFRAGRLLLSVAQRTPRPYGRGRYSAGRYSRNTPGGFVGALTEPFPTDASRDLADWLADALETPPEWVDFTSKPLTAWPLEAAPSDRFTPSRPPGASAWLTQPGPTGAFAPAASAARSAWVTEAVA
jgi:hypothetical protein